MVEVVTGAIVSGIAERAIERTTSAFIEKISLKAAKDKVDAIRLVLNKGLPQYLEANYAKCETLKTLLSRDPRPLDECFVAPDFLLNEVSMSSSDFLRLVAGDGAKAVITGLAGSGKSVFLKYAFRKVIENGTTYYPIFFELRSLNRIQKYSNMLLSELFTSINDCCSQFTRAQFNFGLKTGAFYFLLDGFDEISHDLRQHIEGEIVKISQIFPKCAVLVTSRPSEEFGSWEGFKEARLQPFDLPKVVEYVGKLKFDAEKKKEFCEDLESGIFEANKSFLSNPLLASMMLLTYDSFGEIPEKRHIFYTKCFEVLAREHDNFKGRFRRELYSQLTMDELERVLMFFCAYSYSERFFEFDQGQMKKYVNKALEAAGLVAAVDAIIRDFTESISIMEKVGLLFEFAHRSFQEYFYAKFVVADRRLQLVDKVGWLVDAFAYDDTVEMIADMDRTYFEDDFLLPETKKIAGKIANLDPTANPGRIVGYFYRRIETSHAVDEAGTEKWHLLWEHANSKNIFVLRQAVVKYRHFYRKGTYVPFVDLNLGDVGIGETVAKKFGGSILLNYRNDRKLAELGVDECAASIKSGVLLLLNHLREKQALRQKSLGSLIKRNYSSSRA